MRGRGQEERREGEEERRRVEEKGEVRRRGGIE